MDKKDWVIKMIIVNFMCVKKYPKVTVPSVIEDTLQNHQRYNIN